MYNYQINRSGLRQMMTTDAGLKAAIRVAATNGVAIARSLAPEDSGDLKRSGRVEDLGIRGVQSGEPRMTMAVVFGGEGTQAPYAHIVQGRTGFLTGAIGKWL